MKEGWTYKKLPDLSENLDSLRKPVTKKNRTAGIYPYYGASGIVDYVDDYLFDEDLLCISEDGANLIMRTYPIAFPISGKVWVNNHAHVLRFKSNVTQKYVEYFFAGIKLDKFVTGAAQPKLTQKALNNIKIKIPESVPEQQRIVERLDAAFENIDKLKANAEKQLAEAQTLFQKSLAKAMEPKEGWEVKILKEVTSSIGDGLHGTPMYSDDGDYYFVNGNNFEDGVIEIKDNTKRVNSDEYYKYKINLDETTVLLSINGTIGKTAFYNGEPIILGKSACYINVLPLLLKEFLRYFLLSDNFIEYAKHNSRQATIVNLGLKEIRTMPIPLPPLAVQQRIVERLDALSENIRKYEEIQRQIISECDALKQALLRKVFE